MIDLSNLPDDPGCYIYRNKAGNIIYIGKAKSLKKRVKSYFQNKHHDDKTQALVSEINSVSFFATENEVEALILESNLIKQHKPPYNINLKYSQRYAYILVTDEKYPRLLVARDKKRKGHYYGPYVSAEYRNAMLKTLRTTFRIRTCTKIPKRECLRYHLNLCTAPCINKISKADYITNIHKAESYLKGHEDQLVEQLEKEMQQYSKKQKFEKALILRDQIFSMRQLSDRQRMDMDKRYDEDIINYIKDNKKVYLLVFNIKQGMVASKDGFSFDMKSGFIEEFITQYYADNPVPKELILPRQVNDESIIKYLNERRGAKVTLTIPKAGDKLELLRLVKRNIEISFFKENQMLTDVRDKLHLQEYPQVIECFDIAHLSGTNTVASMVQFRNAKPYKSNYRRYKLKAQGNDDYNSIHEVVSRRYQHLKNKNKDMPDLIVIDGGRGQLNAALSALKNLNLRIPTISLAKKLEEIYVPGLSRPILLRHDSKTIQLLTQLRDEAHRFATTYHKLLRSKEMIHNG